MPVAYLEEFLTLASYLSYTTAARRLNMTQSTLSKHIAALEREFDATLIDRSKQQIELTRQGRIFCEEASKMLDAYHQAYRRIHTARAEVKIAGSLRDSAVRYLTSITQDALRETDAGLLVVSQECATATLRDSLASGKVDVAIDIGPQGWGEDDEEADPRLASSHLMSVPLLAVMNPDHPLAGRSQVSIEELAGVRIMHPTGSVDIQNGANAIEAAFTRHGIEMGKRIFFASSWNDFPAAELGRDVFVMPKSLFSRQLFGRALETYRSVPIIDEDARFPYRVVWRRGERRPEVLRYIEVLKEKAGEIDREG